MNTNILRNNSRNYILSASITIWWIRYEYMAAQSQDDVDADVGFTVHNTRPTPFRSGLRPSAQSSQCPRRMRRIFRRETGTNKSTNRGCKNHTALKSSTSEAIQMHRSHTNVLPYVQLFIASAFVVNASGQTRFRRIDGDGCCRRRLRQLRRPPVNQAAKR